MANNCEIITPGYAFGLATRQVGVVEGIETRDQRGKLDRKAQCVVPKMLNPDELRSYVVSLTTEEKKIFFKMRCARCASECETQLRVVGQANDGSTPWLPDNYDP